MRKKPRKLSLNRETVRNLEDRSLNNAAGAHSHGIVCTGTQCSDCCTATECTTCTCSGIDCC